MSNPFNGSIRNGRYEPPPNLIVTWRRPYAPDVFCSLDYSQPFSSPGDDSVYRRYGSVDGQISPEVIGRQITAIGSEQLGGYAYEILRELYREAGLGDPNPSFPGDARCQAVWDFAIANFARPATPKDYERIIGRPLRDEPPPPPPPEEEDPPVVDPEPVDETPIDVPEFPPIIEQALRLGTKVVMIGPGRKALFNRALAAYLDLDRRLDALQDELDERFPPPQDGP